jgi:hypothetical protein
VAPSWRSANLTIFWHQTAFFLGKQNANSFLITGVAGGMAVLARSHIGTTLA